MRRAMHLLLCWIGYHRMAYRGTFGGMHVYRCPWCHNQHEFPEGE